VFPIFKLSHVLLLVLSVSCRKSLAQKHWSSASNLFHVRADQWEKGVLSSINSYS